MQTMRDDATMHQTGDEREDAGQRIQSETRRMGEAVGEIGQKAQRYLTDTAYAASDAAVEGYRKAYDATDHYVREKPWQALAIAGVVGMIVGMLLHRR